MTKEYTWDDIKGECLEKGEVIKACFPNTIVVSIYPYNKIYNTYHLIYSLQDHILTHFKSYPDIKKEEVLQKINELARMGEEQ